MIALVLRLAARAYLAIDALIVALVAVFLLLLATSLPQVLEGLSANSDQSTAFTLAETMRTPAEDRQIILGDSPWYEPIWLMRATSWLPGRWLIWQLIPFSLWIAGIGIAFVVVRRLVGRARPAIGAAALVAAPGMAMQVVQWAPISHGVVLVHLLILVLMLVVALGDPRWTTGRRGLAALVLGGAVTAVGAVDQLFLLYGLAPFMAAAAYVAVQRRTWRPFLAALALTLVGLVGRTLLVHAGTSAGITSTGRVFNLLNNDRVAVQFGQLPSMLGELVARNAWGAPMERQYWLFAIAGLTACVVLGLLLIAGVRRLWEAARPVLDAMRGDAPSVPEHGAQTGAANGVANEAERALMQDAVLVFAGVAVLAGLFVWLTSGVVFDLTAARYLAPVWIAACIGWPVLGVRTRTEPLNSAVTLGLVLAATVSFEDRRSQTLPDDPFPKRADAAAVARFAAEHGATHGYGAYWPAAALTWHSRFKVNVYPVKACGTANCPYGLGTASDWYRPKGGPTLLITDASPNQPTVDPRYGKPVAQMQQRGLTVRVYAADIATFIER